MVRVGIRVMLALGLQLWYFPPYTINNNDNKALFQAHIWPIIYSSTCATCASGLCHR